MDVKNITSVEASDLLLTNHDTLLIDVRTDLEWKNVGVPDFKDHEVIFLSWRLLPDMSLNGDFCSKLTSIIPNKNKNLLFMCKSGGRSAEAAKMISLSGYVNCYNIVDGFEGGHNGSGWKGNNLSWRVL